jgi:hypothetical protein
MHRKLKKQEEKILYLHDKLKFYEKQYKHKANRGFNVPEWANNDDVEFENS